MKTENKKQTIDNEQAAVGKGLTEKLTEATGRTEAEVLRVLAELITGYYAETPASAGMDLADYRTARVIGVIKTADNPQRYITKEEAARMVIKGYKLK
jgi:hypothetical protein